MKLDKIGLLEISRYGFFVVPTTVLHKKKTERYWGSKFRCLLGITVKDRKLSIHFFFFVKRIILNGFRP